MRIRFAILLSSMLSSASIAGLVGGFDAIGPDNSLTNNLGGPTAVISGPDIFGAPAIEIQLDGKTNLSKLELIAYAAPSSTEGNLVWSHHRYTLNLFRSDEYFNNQPSFDWIVLGGAETAGLTLVEESPQNIVPMSSDIFGQASPDIAQFGSFPTYLLEFDLTENSAFDKPLESGDYVLEFVSLQALGPSGALYIANSRATEGHVPYWHQAYMGRLQHPRGIIDGQDPNNITLRHAINVYEVPFGDFDGDDSLSISDIDALTEIILAGTRDGRFDLSQDGSVDASDHTTWVKQLAGTWFGDANLDGEFNSGDLIQIFQSGKYETDIDASWSEGDWNGDGRVDTSDLMTAFQDGGYEQGPGTVASVPEPTCGFALLIACLSTFTLLGRSTIHRK